MLQLNAYLNFDGNCADAMRFYESTLGGKRELMTHGESPMAAQTPPGSADRIMRARLERDASLERRDAQRVGIACARKLAQKKTD
jgi:PhnB protein